MTPETPDVQPEPVENDGAEPEARETEAGPAADRPENPRKTEVRRLLAVAKDLESSPSAAMLKESIYMFTAERLMTDPVQRKGFMENVRSKTPSLAELFEAMGEAAVENDPKLLERFKKREVTLPQIIEGTLDRMFGEMLVQAERLEEPARSQRRGEIDAAIRDLRTAVSRSRRE